VYLRVDVLCEKKNGVATFQMQLFRLRVRFGVAFRLRLRAVITTNFFFFFFFFFFVLKWRVNLLKKKEFFLYRLIVHSKKARFGSCDIFILKFGGKIGWKLGGKVSFWRFSGWLKMIDDYGRIGSYGVRCICGCKRGRRGCGHMRGGAVRMGGAILLGFGVICLS
jgi:hypothetical protein